MLCTCSFHKRMLSNLTCVLIYSSTIYWKKLHYVESRFLLNKALHQIWFLRNLRNIQRDWQYKSVLVNVIKEGIINFIYFYFDIESYSFLIWSCCRRFEVVVNKNISQQISYLYLARVQSPICTTYEKSLLESIMVVLTPRLGYSK